MSLRPTLVLALFVLSLSPSSSLASIPTSSSPSVLVTIYSLLRLSF